VLSAAAGIDAGSASGGKPRVLFLCTGNAARSQIAEGWARALAGDVFEARSAGTAPKGVDPRAARAMAEVGVDISSHRSKHVKELLDLQLDLVVTVCDAAKESCPTFPGRVRHLHAGFEDPPRLAASAASEEEAMSHYRRVRDEIRAFVERLRRDLAAEGAR